jgi:RimJ/RimL family protein N-acetyltransferase
MIEDKHNNKWIRQFLIDKNYQNKGFGQIALKLILRYIQKKYQTKNVYLSTNNELATYIYLKFGFNETKDKLNDYYKTHFNKTVYSIDLSKFNFNIEIKKKTRMSVVQI